MSILYFNLRKNPCSIGTNKCIVHIISGSLIDVQSKYGDDLAKNNDVSILYMIKVVFKGFCLFKASRTKVDGQIRPKNMRRLEGKMFYLD